MDPNCFVQKTFFLEIKVSAVHTSASNIIFVFLDGFSDIASSNTGHDDKTASVQFQFTLK